MRRKLWLVCLFAVLAGAVLSWNGWHDQLLFERLEASGKTVTATLESVEVTRGRRGKKTLHFQVRYQPDGGVPLVREFAVDDRNGFARRAVRDGRIVAPACEVRYDPDDPAQAVLVGATRNRGELLPYGTGLGLVGLIGGTLLWSWPRRRADATAA